MADDYRRPDYNHTQDTDSRSAAGPVEIEDTEIEETEAEEQEENEFAAQLLADYFARIAEDPELAETVPWEQVRIELGLAA